MPDTSASPATASVSAGIAAANAHLAKSAEPDLRFPQEDGGRSLAEVAQRDLDAALQLLAERAQYITGASGAAVALRRGQHNDMLCRASAGPSAPELGALLSMEYGLSGESARTRQTLRCDDAERDPRVNREGCRRLGIASVLVMPIVNEQQVLGVFELFSGQPNAFEERDISALRRLSEMVTTAVKHAVAAHKVLAAEQPELALEPADAQVAPSADEMSKEAASIDSPVSAVVPVLAPPADVPLPTAEKEMPEEAEPQETEAEGSNPPAAKNPAFWSAALQEQQSEGHVEEKIEEKPEPISIPLVLLTVHKCQACGFPVSEGRTLCLECEEKKWRGQALPQPAADQAPPATIEGIEEAVRAPDADSPTALASPLTETAETVTQPNDSAIAEPAVAAVADVPQNDVPQNADQDVPQDISQEEPVPVPDSSFLFLSSAQPSESWLSANKYVLVALLLVALIVGAIVWLR